MQLVASEVIQLLEDKKVITLNGDLGSGKTTLSGFLISELTGVSRDEVTSPTFTGVNTYDGARRVHHFDLYRLENNEDFLTQGFTDYLDDAAISILEWPEVAREFLPKKRLELHLSHSPDGGRKIQIEEKS